MTAAKNRKQRRAEQKTARTKRPMRAHRWHQQHTAWDLATASPTHPMPAPSYTRHLTRIHLALKAIESDAAPDPDDWRSLTDAINLVDTLVRQGDAQDTDGLLIDAVRAMEQAWQRSERTDVADWAPQRGFVTHGGLVGWWTPHQIDRIPGGQHGQPT